MPNTGAFLAADERIALARWLRDAVAKAGVGKSAIALSAFGDDSTARLNRYLRPEEPELPTAHNLARLADAINVPRIDALWRAGYFQIVLGAINHCYVAACMKELPDSIKPLTGQQLTFALIDFALRAFPRRDFTSKGSAETEQFDALFTRFLGDYISIGGTVARRHMHPLLALVSESLEDTRAPLDTRLAVAGEYVTAWAYEFNFKAASIIRGDRTRAYGQALLLANDPNRFADESAKGA